MLLLLDLIVWDISCMSLHRVCLKPLLNNFRLYMPHSDLIMVLIIDLFFMPEDEVLR